MELTIQKTKNIKKIKNYLNNEIIIGIDPGASGGVSWIDSHSNEIYTEPCPKTNIEMAELIRNIVKNDTIGVQAYLELVHAFPTDGRSSLFKFGTNYGKWQGILASFGIEPIFVTPQKWQKSYGELPKIKKERKNEMKNIARKLSGLKVTLKTADAILIAIYGYSQYMQVNE
tara:strand:+ start:1932 stop:2447 length:516 start_codon:yes stop_codon:yes gene_type:complete